MQFPALRLARTYQSYVAGKVFFIAVLLVMLVLALLLAVSVGAADLSLVTVARTLLGFTETPRIEAIVWNIRLPQALASIVAGAGLAVTGVVMQSILRNPLGSPFTLGISHAAAFGAAFSVMILGGGVMTSSSVGAVNITSPLVTTASAFVFSIGAALVIIAIAQLRNATPEILVLTGVALGALFTAGTMFLQFFADDVQLAAMVFWTFGDTARATWQELGVMAGGLAVCSGYFMCNSWDYNAIDSGDETAKGLGVRVSSVRVVGMLMASLLTAFIIAFLGIIGFIGLIVPHMVRRVIGSDHRFLLPASLIGGGLLLLVSDTVARQMLAPHVLPVSVLTAFLGAPAFFWLIMLRSRS